jgi:hypothetical protein
MKMNEGLINAAIEQILIDVQRGDLTAIEEMLTHVPEEILVGFLSGDEENIDIDFDGGLSATNEQGE